MKNPILSSFKELLKLMKRHKPIIMGLFLLQIVFFSVLFFINVKYQTRIYESATGVLEYLEKQQLDEEAVGVGLLSQQSILGEDPLMIYRNYRLIFDSVILLLALSLLAFAAINGLNWFLTDYMINNKKMKSFFVYFGKFVAITAAYSVLIFLFLYAAFKSSIMEAVSSGSLPLASFVPLLFLLAIFYFAFISLALTGRHNLKDILKNTLSIGTKKARILVVAYLINIVVVVSFAFLLFLSADLHILILMTAMALFISSFIFSRIFLVLVVNNLHK